MPFFELVLFDESLLLSVEEYEPLLNSFESPLLEDEVFESELLEESLLLLEKFPDLNPSPLLELVAPSLLPAVDLLDEPLKDPDLKPLLDLELWLILLDLPPLDLAKAIVLLIVPLDLFTLINDSMFNGKLENMNINIKNIVKIYFF